MTARRTSTNWTTWPVQAAGGTPLYRSLFPEPADNNADPAFTTGLIDEVEDTAPAGLNQAIVLFTDGEDSECGGPTPAVSSGSM